MTDNSPLGLVNQNSNEMSRVLKMADELHPVSPGHRLMLAMLIYIFNLHNQPHKLPRTNAPSSMEPGNDRHPYRRILSHVALELCQPENSTAKTEREVTLWTMVAIASASSFSPWRLEIPFMGHLIEWMDNDEVTELERCPETREAHVTTDRTPDTDSSPRSAQGSRQKYNNLDKLTSCLRGYYLYGADKKTLRRLRKRTNPDQPHGLLEYA